MSSESRIQARAAELRSARVSEAGFRIAKRLPSNRHDPAGIAGRSIENRMTGAAPARARTILFHQDESFPAEGGLDFSK
ncbi:MAG: hypothetical protein PGN34_20330 [Methylobacterium frigidaeris]